ncbi:MAG: ATP synthase F0 subunit B [Acidimicrobiales bacterium]
MSDQTYLGPDADPGYEGEEAVDAGVEGIIDELIDIVATAKSVPLSSSVMISRDEVLELLEAAREEMPEELKRAKRLLKDRDEVFTSAKREAAEIVDDARVQAERMVQRTEIVRQAEYRAVRIVEDAEAESRRLKHEAEDYVDQRLAGFEIVLDRTMKTVRAGRERLAAVPADPHRDDDDGRDADGELDEDDESLFDQDLE